MDALPPMPTSASSAIESRIAALEGGGQGTPALEYELAEVLDTSAGNRRTPVRDHWHFLPCADRHRAHCCRRRKQLSDAADRRPGGSDRQLTEIAELLGMTHQLTSVIVGQPGFLSRSASRVRDACGIGERSRRGRRGDGVRSRGGRPSDPRRVVVKVAGAAPPPAATELSETRPWTRRNDATGTGCAQARRLRRLIRFVPYATIASKMTQRDPRGPVPDERGGLVRFL
jgi:hypothetical protein